MVMKDVFVIKNVINRWIVRREGYKNWLFFLFNCNVIIVLYIGCKNNFIVRLEIVRFRISFLKDVGSDEIFSMVWIIRIFLIIVIGEKVK